MKSISSIRIFIALASIYKPYIHQTDVKTVFFNIDLEGNIYMAQPEKYIVFGQENKVYKLIKYLYCLKQVPKQWHKKLNNVLTSDGFPTIEVERFIYTNVMNNDCVIISLYVDDMLIFCTNMNFVLETKGSLASNLIWKIWMKKS